MIDRASLEELIAQYFEKIGKNTSNLSPEEIMERINSAIIQNIPDEKLTEFEQIFNGKNDEEIMNFIKKEIPHFDLIINQALS